jgi:hypothetical protein
MHSQEFGWASSLPLDGLGWASVVRCCSWCMLFFWLHCFTVFLRAISGLCDIIDTRCCFRIKGLVFHFLSLFSFQGSVFLLPIDGDVRWLQIRFRSCLLSCTYHALTGIWVGKQLALGRVVLSEARSWCMLFFWFHCFSIF